MNDIQMKARLELEDLGKHTQNTDPSTINRIQEMDETISGIEDIAKKFNTSVKENPKFKKYLINNIQEVWDTVKRPNRKLKGIEHSEQSH